MTYDVKKNRKKMKSFQQSKFSYEIFNKKPLLNFSVLMLSII